MVCFRNFCLCCTLTKGGIIMGACTFVNSLVQLVGSIVGLVATYKDPEKGSASEDSIWNLFDKGEENKSRPMYWVAIVASLALMICAGAMIKGSIQRRRGLLVPYLTVGLFNILQSIVYIVMVVKSDTEDSKPGMYVYLGFSMVFQLYFWLCAFSLFQWLREEEERGGPGLSHSYHARA